MCHRLLQLGNEADHLKFLALSDEEHFELLRYRKSINRICVNSLPKIQDNIMNEKFRFGEEKRVLGLLAHTIGSMIDLCQLFPGRWLPVW